MKFIKIIPPYDANDPQKRIKILKQKVARPTTEARGGGIGGRHSQNVKFMGAREDETL